MQLDDVTLSACCSIVEANSMAALSLHEHFDGLKIHPRLRWHCEPERWLLESARGFLQVEPDGSTDFWQRTHYGIEADNGHFLHATVAGDFVLVAHSRVRPAHQYDQAGLMVRVSADCWLKTSVEHETTAPDRLGVVVTNFGYSDWSSQAFLPKGNEVWLRVRREGDDYLVDAARDGTNWAQIRMAHLHAGRGAAVQCGIYACSPKAAGLVAEFSDLRIDSGRITEGSP